MCPEHGGIVPLWRPAVADYEHFAELVTRAVDIPAYLPWPMSPGWSIADFGWVAGSRQGAVATVTTTVGTSDLDGQVEVSLVVEEPAIGLGTRIAGTMHSDPGAHVGHGPAAIRIRAAGRQLPMWSVPAGDGDDVLARAVFAGEASGRWLWLVIRPASAALLLRDEWLLADAAGFGPSAFDMPFGGGQTSW